MNLHLRPPFAPQRWPTSPCGYFSLGCVTAERYFITSSHHAGPRLSHPTGSHAANVSASHLNIHREKPSGQSVRPSVCVGCRLRTPRQTPLPLLHLALAADWLTFCSVAAATDSVSSFLEWRGRDGEGLLVGEALPSRSRWAEIERCQQRLIIGVSFPKQTYC